MKTRRDYLILLLVFMFGFILGMALVYKVEVNTINEALNSLNYCYQTYALK